MYEQPRYSHVINLDHPDLPAACIIMPVALLVLAPLFSVAPLRRAAPPPTLQPDTLLDVRASLVQVPDASFKAWPALNDENTRRSVNAGRRHRLHLDDPTLALLDERDSLLAKFARSLAVRKAVDRKEFFEACEFFGQARSCLKAAEDGDGVATLVDVAGGHGLVGALGAMLKPNEFDRVVVVDQRRPKAFDAVVEAAIEAAPWVEGRISFETRRIGPHGEAFPRHSAVACVHGCRSLTDKIIAAAAAAEAKSIALMPCCYPSDGALAPAALQQALGRPLAADVQRTYALEGHGYSVKWKAVPPSLTPMNRVLLASRKARV